VKLKNIPQSSPNIVYFSEIKKIFCESWNMYFSPAFS
jgi:hypothetical protein